MRWIVYRRAKKDRRGGEMMDGDNELLQEAATAGRRSLTDAT